jgi:hypothetical protein
LATDFIFIEAMEETDNKVENRIKLLLDFYKNFEEYYSKKTSHEKKKVLRSKLNRNLIATKNAVIDAGTNRYINETDRKSNYSFSFDPFDNLFVYENGLETIENIMRRANFQSSVLNQIEQAIGVYEHIQSESGLISLNPKEAIDIESAIERALRPAFRDVQPKLEKEIQDAIENILNALGIKFTRDREITSVAGKAFKPDFIIEEIDLAIEVKLAKSGHGVAQIQEEMNADISAYRTRWKNLLFVIYDLGVINDPYKFQTENIKLFGISVRVIKH